MNAKWVTGARFILGIIFTVFGFNGFFHFLPMPPMLGPAGDLLGAFGASGYLLDLIMGTQVVGGLLLLVGYFVPLALVLLAPVIVNIVAFHIFLAPSGLPLAIVVAVLEIILVVAYRARFAGILLP